MEVRIKFFTGFFLSFYRQNPYSGATSQMVMQLSLAWQR